MARAADSEKLRLAAVLAHPDDESLGFGGPLAKYSSEGVQTFVITATRGERGRNGSSRDMEPAELGAIREAELSGACGMLGVRKLHLLGYADGSVDRVNARMAVADISALLRRIKPHVVVTFGPEGAYGHPDHIAISQFATAAVVDAAASHQVPKLYYLEWPLKKWDAYQAAFKMLTSKVDNIERRATPWPDWAITTVVDTASHAGTVWRAACCHRTQMSVYRQLENLCERHHCALWGSQESYRVFSLVNGGRSRETDLFEGLREKEGDDTGTVCEADLRARTRA
jgi:LmbE family N-acetylglucosaminyl deacetylase